MWCIRIRIIQQQLGTSVTLGNVYDIVRAPIEGVPRIMLIIKCRRTENGMADTTPAQRPEITMRSRDIPESVATCICKPARLRSIFTTMKHIGGHAGVHYGTEKLQRGGSPGRVTNEHRVFVKHPETGRQGHISSRQTIR